ncbi:MAG: hypothetical protein WCO60_15610 [Verrucomicrobiota bacterium]
MPQSRLFSVWAALFGLSVCLGGCAQWCVSPLKATEYCFVPLGNDTYPSRVWARGERVPVLQNIPKGHRVIGHFSAYYADSSKFLEDAMDYNAKRVGADAIVVQNITRLPDRYFVADHVEKTEKWVSPDKSDRDWYREKRKEFETKAARGVWGMPPEEPRAKRQVTSEKFVPEHWAIRSERASVEAVFLRRE